MKRVGYLILSHTLVGKTYTKHVKICFLALYILLPEYLRENNRSYVRIFTKPTVSVFNATCQTGRTIR